MASTVKREIGSRASALIARHGRSTLLILCAIVVVGFGLRAYRVVEPLADPGDDASAYRALAASLYEDGSYGHGFTNPSDWSPGAPLIYAAAYYATGGVRDGLARGVEAIFGTAAIVIVFLLTRRLSRRRWAALAAAAAAAVYPPFIHSTGALMSEPPAIFMLPAAVLAFFWADERGGWMPWALPGALFGLTALIRPEYLIVGVAFALLALVRIIRRRGSRAGIAAAAALLVAFLIPIVPWSVRNYIQLDRVVPISTGSGKALYVGTYLPGDGDYQRVKSILVERYTGRRLEPGSAALDRVDPVPLFDRVASRHPHLSRDASLGKTGKQNMRRFIEERPLDYAAMTVRKVGRMWGSGIGEAMSSPLGSLVQKAVVLLALAGLIGLACLRRWWQFLVYLVPIGLITAVGAVSLAPSRRNEILMTLVLPLAAAALAAGWGRLMEAAGRERATGRGRVAT